ncbi:MAG: hypothetical protein WD557_10310 [Dehalococcoidia bacterium]
MFSTNRSRLFLASLSVIAAAIVGVASAYLVNNLRNGEDRFALAQGVEVTGSDGIVVGQGVTSYEALRIASEKLGYEVKGLDFIPGGGFELRTIVLGSGPYEMSPRTAKLHYTKLDATADRGILAIGVSEVNQPRTRPTNWRPVDDPNQLFDIGVPDVEVWVNGDQMRRVYSWNVGERSYALHIDQRQPPDDEVRRMIRELID